VEVSFRTNKLQKAYGEADRAYREWGKPVGRKYIQRVGMLYDMPTFEGIMQARALRTHPLKGEREGDWALDLTGDTRLIVAPSDDGKSVEVKEVSKHYD
jgi:proteic killer suppression protein